MYVYLGSFWLNVLIIVMVVVCERWSWWLLILSVLIMVCWSCVLIMVYWFCVLIMCWFCVLIMVCWFCVLIMACWYYWLLLYSAVLRCWADSLRSHVILHEWLAFYRTFFNYIHQSGVLTALAWLVPHETAAVLAQVLCTPYNHAPCRFISSCKATYVRQSDASNDSASSYWSPPHLCWIKTYFIRLSDWRVQVLQHH